MTRPTRWLLPTASTRRQSPAFGTGTEHEPTASSMKRHRKEDNRPPCPKCGETDFSRWSFGLWDAENAQGQWSRGGTVEEVVCVKCGAKLERYDDGTWQTLDEKEWNSKHLPACPICGGHDLTLIRFTQLGERAMQRSGGDASIYATCGNCGAKLATLYMLLGGAWETVDEEEWQLMMEAEQSGRSRPSTAAGP